MSCTEDTALRRSPIKRNINNVSPVWYYIDKDLTKKMCVYREIGNNDTYMIKS